MVSKPKTFGLVVIEFQLECMPWIRVTLITFSPITVYTLIEDLVEISLDLLPGIPCSYTILVWCDNLISLSLIVVPSWFDVKCSIPRDNTYRSYCSKFKPSFVPYFGKDNLRTFPIHFYIIVKLLHLTSNSFSKTEFTIFFHLFIVLYFDLTILEKIY